MVHRVEGRRQVQKDQSGEVATVDREEDVGQDAQDGGLGMGNDNDGHKPEQKLLWRAHTMSCMRNRLVPK